MPAGAASRAAKGQLPTRAPSAVLAPLQAKAQYAELSDMLGLGGELAGGRGSDRCGSLQRQHARVHTHTLATLSLLAHF